MFKWAQHWLCWFTHCSGHCLGPESLSSTRRPPVQRTMKAFCPHMTQNLPLQRSAQCPFHTASMHHAAIHSYFSDPSKKRIKWLLSLAGRSQSPPRAIETFNIESIYSQYTEPFIKPILSSQKNMCFCGRLWIFKNFIHVLSIPSSLLLLGHILKSSAIFLSKQTKKQKQNTTSLESLLPLASYRKDMSAESSSPISPYTQGSGPSISHPVAWLLAL